MRWVDRILVLSLLILMANHLVACTKSDPDGSSEYENTSTLIGTVEDISATTWTIDDKVVQVGDEVLITGNILIGDQVEALITLGENATLQALEINFISRSPSEDGDNWTIGGRGVLITTKTAIEPEIALGDEVKVEGILDDGGSLVAQEIKLLGAN